jgi:hypothetical protein
MLKFCNPYVLLLLLCVQLSLGTVSFSDVYVTFTLRYATFCSSTTKIIFGSPLLVLFQTK